jgi:hypothetical protein
MTPIRANPSGYEQGFRLFRWEQAAQAPVQSRNDLGRKRESGEEERKLFSDHWKG